MSVKNSTRKVISEVLAQALMCVFALSAQAAPPSVLTQHNDNARTGANLAETLLTPANVKTASFGKLFTRTLDANVNGQVLYVPSLFINGNPHNTIIAYTSNNANNSPCSVYAYDADDPNQSVPLWRHQFPASAQWTTCTPVIDAHSRILYVLTKDTNDSGPTRLRALDLLTGNEEPGSPITIAASVPGTGDGNVNGVVSFDTSHANCRPGLLLLNGIVYFAFAHNSDSFPYHGWVFGYRYNGSAFTQTALFCTNPNGGLDGIWMAGQGLATDTNGNIYCTVGNGTFDVNNGGTSYGMCVLKLSTPSLHVVDWFAPYDELIQSNADLDVGSAGVVGIPGTTRLFTGATKFGAAFLVDTSNLGHFTANGPDNVVQRFDDLTPDNDVGQNPVCWDAGTKKYVYLWPGSTELLQFQYDTTVNKFNPAEVYKQTSGQSAGGSLAVSANGAQNAILWAVGNDSVLHAFDATDVSKPELWNSSQNANRDGLDSVGHFQFPTVVNGKVYVPTGSASIAVYGLLPASTIIGDSVGEFSNIQGQNDWYYGYYATPDLPSSFTQMTAFLNWRAWAESATQPPWTYVSSQYQHPRGKNEPGGLEHWSVRRYVSPKAGTLLLQGALKKADVSNPRGTGIYGHIFHNGQEVYVQYIGPVDGVGVNYSVTVPGVAVGDTIDFVVAPNGFSGNDSTYFNATITLQP